MMSPPVHVGPRRVGQPAAITSCPCSCNAVNTCDPMNPVAQVSVTLIAGKPPLFWGTEPSDARLRAVEAPRAPGAMLDRARSCKKSIKRLLHLMSTEEEPAHRPV